MALHRKLSEQLVVLLHLIIGVQLVLAAPQPNDPSCNRICGSVNIPYPFGTSEGCYLDKSFLIKCNNSFQPPKPFLAVDNIEVLNISTDDGELRVSNLVFRSCEWWPVYDNQPSLRRISALLSLSNFSISLEKNSIFAVGCNFFAYISGWQGQHYTFMSGCTSVCGKSTGLVNGSCSGLGCCHSAIPENATKYNLTVQSIYTNGSSRTSGQSCGLGFIGETQAYTFSTLDFENLMNRETVPLLLDWAIANKKCEDAQKNWSSYLCKAANSNCSEPNALGYICKCPEGYQGNPYILDGKDGSCQGISISLLILLVGTLWVYWVMQRRKLIKLKEKFFQQNGGLILQRQLLNHKEYVESAKIFSAKELGKATNNYDKSRVLGQGGFGTVYKGILSDDKVVAIKKSNVVDQSQIEQFINEVVVLTKINHKNVVKLLGCCLETEVPLLVYEFITNGTLFDHIHDKNLSSSLSWEKRLKVASETAGALAYIHFETSMSIIHRDVKTTNILMDDNHTAKVSDFGASRLVPLDHTRLTTVVQGTLGYLDPKYFHTSQLTEKSDVYSFGVVIAELLTGEKALSMDRPEAERNLAMYFVTAMKEDRLLQIIDDRILIEGNIEEIKEVANIAKKCLKVRGEDRPSMKQVTKELEGLRLLEKHSLKKVDSNIQQITKHLPYASTHALGIDVDVGSSSMSTIVADDSMKNQILKPTDNDAR
ncbi:hypothetical protein F2P56_012085 [Juglans regia]|uniref:Protein kinase domain-containing protein n=1 Tax=Juglans regia TaxID=51240 RepID=A0A834CTX9_JUGRE|nr:hypothetical protein F2P56_012085 [Juglans regia]